MHYTHCIGIDFGTLTIKIVVRDLELDEVSPVSYADGRAVTIPSFASLTKCGQIIISPSNNSMQLRQWRFDNLNEKIPFQRDFSKQITADIPLSAQ